MLFQDTQTTTALTVKPTAYTNTGKGITEPQRKVILALSKGRGHYLAEHTTMKGRKVYRCFDARRNVVSPNFSRKVVLNLVSKGYLRLFQTKYFLK